MIYNYIMDEKILISAVEPQKRKKDRYNIYSDGEYVCSLGAESIVIYGIKQGTQIKEEKLKNAIEADNMQYAFDSAVSLLSFRMRTKKEIRDKLAEKKIDANAVEKAIDKLAGYGYIDDEKYAVLFIESAVSEAKYGRKVIEYKLRQKGISDDNIEKAMQLYPDDAEKQAASVYYKTLMRKYSNEEPKKKRSKIYSNLARRGFSYDVINSLITGDDDFE